MKKVLLYSVYNNDSLSSLRRRFKYSLREHFDLVMRNLYEIEERPLSFSLHVDTPDDDIE